MQVIAVLQELFQSPRSSIEKRFSRYFYRYFGRYKDPHKFSTYLHLCRSIVQMTRAEGSSVLDLGCGFGLMSILIGVSGAKEVVGYDSNTEKIELFQRLLSSIGPEIKNVKPVLGDSTSIDFPDNSFDVVIANESISHFRDFDTSIREVHRVLKLGGIFLIRDGNNSFFLPGRIQRRRFWKRIEKGPVDPAWFRGTDLPLPYSEVRKKVIQERRPSIDTDSLHRLAKMTAGMVQNEIFEAIDEFEKMGTICRRPAYRYRNPVTGEFPEREINPFGLRAALRANGFNVSFAPYFYSKWGRNAEMIIKRVFYLIEKSIPLVSLPLVPGFTLLGIKKDKVE